MFYKTCSSPCRPAHREGSAPASGTYRVWAWSPSRYSIHVPEPTKHTNTHKNVGSISTDNHVLTATEKETYRRWSGNSRRTFETHTIVAPYGQINSKTAYVRKTGFSAGSRPRAQGQTPFYAKTVVRPALEYRLGRGVSSCFPQGDDGWTTRHTHSRLEISSARR